jgi:hypothetical protein
MNQPRCDLQAPEGIVDGLRYPRPTFSNGSDCDIDRITINRRTALFAPGTRVHGKRYEYTEAHGDCPVCHRPDVQ